MEKSSSLAPLASRLFSFLLKPSFAVFRLNSIEIEILGRITFGEVAKMGDLVAES